MERGKEEVERVGKEDGGVEREGEHRGKGGDQRRDREEMKEERKSEEEMLRNIRELRMKAHSPETKIPEIKGNEKIKAVTEKEFEENLKINNVELKDEKIGMEGGEGRGKMGVTSAVREGEEMAGGAGTIDKVVTTAPTTEVNTKEEETTKKDEEGEGDAEQPVVMMLPSHHKRAKVLDLPSSPWFLAGAVVVALVCLAAVLALGHRLHRPAAAGGGAKSPYSDLSPSFHSAQLAFTSPGEDKAATGSRAHKYQAWETRARHG